MKMRATLNGIFSNVRKFAETQQKSKEQILFDPGKEKVK